MQSLQQRIAELSLEIERLTLLGARSEARLRALERRRRWLPVVLLGGGLLGFLLGQFSANPQSAWADSGPSPAKGAEHFIEAQAKAAARDLTGLDEKERQHFDALIEGVRRDLNRAEETTLDPARMIAVTLHDMKRLFESMPRMANDMHRMTSDMHEMNQKMSAVPAMATEMNVMNRQMGVMAQGVDSTMGRMGRMMPWVP